MSDNFWIVYANVLILQYILNFMIYINKYIYIYIYIYPFFTEASSS